MDGREAPEGGKKTPTSKSEEDKLEVAIKYKRRYQNVFSEGVDTSAEFSMWTNEAVEKGTRFLPWKGTVRSDKLAVYNKLPDFDVSNTTISRPF